MYPDLLALPITTHPFLASLSPSMAALEMRVPVFIHARKTLQLVLLTLILWSSIQVKPSDGRPLGAQQASITAAEKPLHKLQEIVEVGVEEKLMVRTLIGSRPPRCEGKCIACGHCEPVQVPIVPEAKRGASKFTMATSNGGDYGSNYKPMKWKCKCGRIILNP